MEFVVTKLNYTAYELDRLYNINSGGCCYLAYKIAYWLEKYGIEYYFVYMTGLSGRGGEYRNAVNSAKLFSQLNPYFISVDSLTLFPETELYQRYQEGTFLPSTEKDRLRELQIFISTLQLRIHLFADSKSNFYPTTAYLPKKREKILGELQHVIDTVDEKDMEAYRAGLRSLG